jgi:hypothetical protein
MNSFAHLLVGEPVAPWIKSGADKREGKERAAVTRSD